MTAQNAVVRASVLRKLPHLKSCPYWDRATFLGCVSHRLPFAHYDGGLVTYNGVLYYITRSQIEALRPWLRWNLRAEVAVIDD